eukprot:scaffold3550_cov112-Isochrysis_galbana.AAC.4
MRGAQVGRANLPASPDHAAKLVVHWWTPPCAVRPVESTALHRSALLIQGGGAGREGGVEG